jgi:hypothetical protein
VKTPKKHQISLTAAELHLVLEALDSHRYWQLSDEQYRNSGYVMDPGSDDEENAETIREISALEARLGNLGPCKKTREIISKMGKAV